MWNTNQDNTSWVSRTDGKPICIDCIFYDNRTGKCSIQRNKLSSTMGSGSCSFYESRIDSK